MAEPGRPKNYGSGTSGKGDQPGRVQSHSERSANFQKGILAAGIMLRKSDFDRGNGSCTIIRLSPNSGKSGEEEGDVFDSPFISW